MSELKRVYARLDEKDYERMRYWAHEANLSCSEYIVEAIVEKMARDSGDVNAPQLYVQRLGELTYAVQQLIYSNESIRDEVAQGFKSLLGVMRFGDYLSEDLEMESDEEEV